MRIAGLFFLVLLAANAALAQVSHLDSVQFVKPAAVVPGHPRLLLLEGEEEQLRRSISQEPTWKAVHDEILRRCDSLLVTQPVERVLFGVRLLAKSRECLYRVFHLSYAWRMTHKDVYLRRAEKELLAVAAFSDWNPGHYLDVAEMTLAVAIGYDWLYSGLSAETRNTIAAAIRDKGVATSYDKAYPNYHKWLSVTNNWNQVCNAGISFGALAIWENDPEFARKVINRSVASIDIAMKDYEPDGAFAEGYTYWGYGTTFNILFLSALEKAFRADFGLGQNKGFLKTAAYLENMAGPTGAAFNYSDASERSALQPAMFWFAGKLRMPSLLWNERNFLSADHLRQNADRLLPAIMIWGKGIPIGKISPPANRLWTGAGRNPVAFMRTSWTDPNAVYVAVKGGSPSVTHGHMDAGAFVMEADGVRWAMDFGFQEYTALELRNINLWADKQDGQRWQIFRYNNFSHNTLTVNGQLQRADGRAGLVAADLPDASVAVIDLTSNYNGQLANTRRGIALGPNGLVLVRDELEALAGGATVRWQMLTQAEVKLNGNEAELTKSGKKLILKTDSPVVWQTWPTTPPRDYDEPNPGTTLVGFETRLAPGQRLSYNVFLIPEHRSVNTRLSAMPLNTWLKK